MTDWQQLYVRCDDPAAVEAGLIDALTAHGYVRYDPFPGGTGTPPRYKTFVRLFVAPPVDGWIRVIGGTEAEITPHICKTLSAGRALFRAWITGSEGGVEAYQDGRNAPERLAAMPDKGVKTPDPSAQRETGLPPEIEQLARERNVNPQQAAKLINRLTVGIFGKLDRASGGEASAMRSQARALINAQRVDWESAAAQRVLAAMSGLGLPAHEPDFEAVRDAYQAARRLQRNPGARLLPDEREALQRVPEAARYIAVYVGK